MSLETIRTILDRAKDLGTVEWIYFEGGEPFQYYAVLLSGVRMAARMGFRVGVVSNAYWATDRGDASEYLGPLAGLIDDFTVSADWYHWSPDLRQNLESACNAAVDLGIPFQLLCVVCPESLSSECDLSGAKVVQAEIMYRGRAAASLGPDAPLSPWLSFTSCNHEDLRDPGRVHVDPFGNVHVCQGISIGNALETSLRDICDSYRPDDHPVVAPLVQGGPVELALRYGLDHRASYADSCHACYDMRVALRRRFPDILTPNQMYGVVRELDPLESLATHYQTSKGWASG
jgi:MoaA/NifB/PqqE/SkfB family radical SAM enzyme